MPRLRTVRMPGDTRPGRDVYDRPSGLSVALSAANGAKGEAEAR